jgi:hypothetical protein
LELNCRRVIIKEATGGRVVADLGAGQPAAGKTNLFISSEALSYDIYYNPAASADY